MVEGRRRQEGDCDDGAFNEWMERWLRGSHEEKISRARDDEP